ncbi:A/G-specific adenine glycosylase, partial [Myxococcota bacterium]|nr:A/G-specific adenine glycosylase [Myxococcota bacterium]
VRPRYKQFLKQYPDLSVLAASTEESVCEAWAGLGYYSRARNLHRAAQLVRDEYQGEMPKSAAALQKLPGIGRYTAGAIASIAYDEKAPLVDGNVARLLSRLLKIEDAPDTSIAQKTFWLWAERLADCESPGELNQSLMELGSLVCKPKNPECERCPVSGYCIAQKEGLTELLPLPKSKTPKKDLAIVFLLIQSEQGVWLKRRPLKGLWPGLWEPPSAEGRFGRKELSERFGVELGRVRLRLTHELSHRHVKARVFLAPSELSLQEREDFRLFRDPLTAPLSGLARKALIMAKEAALSDNW